MTNLTKIVFGTATLLLAFIFVIGTFQLISLSKNTNIDLTGYTARKEELLLQQQKLQSMITELNATLVKNVGVNQQLAQRLQIIDSQIASVTNQSVSTTTAQPVQMAPPPPMQKLPVPSVQRVTRAS